MDPITKGLDEVRYHIPRRILDYVFITHPLQNRVQIQPNQHRPIVSLETRIRTEVIEPRVLTDINLIGQTEAYIPLDKAIAYHYDPFTIVYEIPDEVLQGRDIVQVYTIHFAPMGYQSYGMSLQYTENAMSRAGREVLDSVLKNPPAGTSFMNILSPNTIMVRYLTTPFNMGFMRVRLSNDEHLSAIRAQAVREFSKLCVLATKAHIYNFMMIEMDEGQLQGGLSLGAFRETIERYEDANELYDEQLTKWMKISVFNDPEAMRRHIRTIVPKM